MDLMQPIFTKKGVGRIRRLDCSEAFRVGQSVSIISSVRNTKIPNYHYPSAPISATECSLLHDGAIDATTHDSAVDVAV